MFKRFFYCTLFLWSVMQIHHAKAETLVHGPYLQIASQTSMTVRWRTDTSVIGKVLYGESASNLNQSAVESASTTEHDVALSGLQPATTYYYAVGAGSSILAGDETYRFRTFPAAGTTDPIRVWVLGDPGTGSANAQGVYTAYLAFTGTNRTDLLLTLGDNAYNDGTDAALHDQFFNIYPAILRTTPVFPSFGNHDARSADSATQTGPYYDNFSLPTNGECGGTASVTEAYYSFDFGNAHFMCLDSAESDRTTNGAMYAWAEHDLMACTSTWIIAYWHHAPYSMGTHNSDTDALMTEMRQYLVPLMEQYGVDLVLGGHSHTYEQTYLLDGHYGLSTSFDLNVHALNHGDGKPAGDGAYMKPSTIKAPHSGTVYVLAGASGNATGSLLGNHPAVESAILGYGSTVLDIEANRLDLIYLNDAGAVVDSFTILKGEGDYDGDGMPDLWEQDTFRINVAPDGNADHDSQDNLDECIAGTDPNDAASYFHITTNTVDLAGFVLYWSSASNRSYDVQWTDGLTNPMVNIQTNIPYPQNSFTDTLHATAEEGFYQIEVYLAE